MGRTVIGHQKNLQQRLRGALNRIPLSGVYGIAVDSRIRQRPTQLRPTRMDPDGQEGRRALDFKNAAASGAYDPDDLKDQSSHSNKRGSQALCDDNYNVVLTAVERLVDAGDHRKNVLRFFARMAPSACSGSAWAGGSLSPGSGTPCPPPDGSETSRPSAESTGSAFIIV